MEPEEYVDSVSSSGVVVAACVAVAVVGAAGGAVGAELGATWVVTVIVEVGAVVEASVAGFVAGLLERVSSGMVCIRYFAPWVEVSIMVAGIYLTVA